MLFSELKNGRVTQCYNAVATFSYLKWHEGPVSLTATYHLTSINVILKKQTKMNMVYTLLLIRVEIIKSRPIVYSKLIGYPGTI